MALSKPHIEISKEQEDAVRTVCDYFGFSKDATLKSRYVLLLAMMQCGKTSTFHKIIRAALKHGVKRVYIVCGTESNTLYRQAEGDTVRLNGWACPSLVKYWAKRWDADADGPRLSAKRRGYTVGCTDTVQVIFHQHLERAAMNIDARDSLFILDESHLNQSKKGKINSFFKKLGLCLAGATSRMEDMNSYILSVSATPLSELKDIRKHGLDRPGALIVKRAVVMKQPAGHYGIPQYMADNRLKKTASLCTPEGRNRFIRHADGRNLYILIRLNKGPERAALKAICDERNYKLLTYDGSNKQLAAVDERLSGRAPSRPTVILLKGMMRCGNVVPKRYVGMVWDGSAAPEFDTILQSLLGRMCGFEGAFGAEKPYIFVPPNCFEKEGRTGFNQVQRYIRLFENGIDSDEQFIMPTSGTNLKKPRDAEPRDRWLVRFFRIRACLDHLGWSASVGANKRKRLLNQYKDELISLIKGPEGALHYSMKQREEMLEILEDASLVPALRNWSDHRVADHMVADHRVADYIDDDEVEGENLGHFHEAMEKHPLNQPTLEQFGAGVPLTFARVVESDKYPEEVGWVYVGFQLSANDVLPEYYCEPDTTGDEMFDPTEAIRKERKRRMKKAAEARPPLEPEDDVHAKAEIKCDDRICESKDALVAWLDFLISTGRRQITGELPGIPLTCTSGAATGQPICLSRAVYGSEVDVIRLFKSLQSHYNVQIYVQWQEVTEDSLDYRIKQISWTF